MTKESLFNKLEELLSVQTDTAESIQDTFEELLKIIELAYEPARQLKYDLMHLYLSLGSDPKEEALKDDVISWIAQADSIVTSISKKDGCNFWKTIEQEDGSIDKSTLEERFTKEMTRMALEEEKRILPILRYYPVTNLDKINS